MALPHPQACYHQNGNGDVTDDGRVFRQILERAVDIADDLHLDGITEHSLGVPLVERP